MDTRQLPAAQGHNRAGAGFGHHGLLPLKNFMGSGLMTEQLCADTGAHGQDTRLLT